MRTKQEIETRFAPRENLDLCRSFFLVGIGGAGMSGVAGVLQRRGYCVCGSDAQDSEAVYELRRAGVEVVVGHSDEGVEGCDALVLSDAIDLVESPEVLRAEALGVPLFRRSQVLGWLLREKKCICVTGTHGKTTTTGMIGAGLLAAGMDPTIVVGAVVPEFGGAVVEGSGEWAVLEACEAYDSLRDFDPEIVVLTNLELDHVDFHGSFHNLRDSMIRFLRRLGRAQLGGDLIYCAENEGSREIGNAMAEGSDCFRVHAYHAATYASEGGSSSIRLPGEHNVLNASGALLACREAGADIVRAAEGIANFKGAERRLQIMREADLVLVDDYAHTPREIEASILGLKGKWPSQRLVVVYQPHLYSRTAGQEQAFADALSLADIVVLTDIYPAREAPVPGVSSARIAEVVTKPVHYTPQRHLLPRYVAGIVKEGDVVVGMGAGNISEFAPAFLKELDRRVGVPPTTSNLAQELSPPEWQVGETPTLQVDWEYLLEEATFLDPHKSVEQRKFRHLPHWPQDQATYDVTFRLADSLPQKVLLAWKDERAQLERAAMVEKRELSDIDRLRLKTLHSEKLGAYLDAGRGSCWLKRPAIAELVLSALKHFDGERYRLLAWCVMPNHVHVIFRIFPGLHLESVLHSWKSYTSKEANRILQRSGEFWQKESFDHIVRDEKDFSHSIQYVIGNPEQSGLKDWRWRGTAERPIERGPNAESGRQDADPTWVAVIYGGDSAEREVSLHSGSEVQAALERKGYNAQLVDLSELLLSKGDLSEFVGAQRPDAAFLCVHGTNAEDGAIQGLFELLHLPYTGSDILSSALAMDKHRTKTLLAENGIAVPRGILLKRNESLKNDIRAQKYIVKPNAQGSTVGLTFVEDENDLLAAIEKAFCYGDEVLIEEMIEGIEISIPVLGDKALPAVEIVPNSGRYDFASKYLPGATEEIVPARISEKIAKKAVEIAVKCHQVLGCRGATRTDFIVADDEQAYVLELNTLPGLTSTSLLPRSAKAAGIEFDDLCEWILMEAVNRDAHPT